MSTSSTLSPDRDTAPTVREIADVEAGVNDRLVAAAGEKPHADPAVAALQADRDRCAARGDFARADRLADRADVLAAYLGRRELADVDRER